MSWSKIRKWAVRTIKNGEVRISGVTYRPEAIHMPYDGRLDGLRMAFGRYWVGQHEMTLRNGLRFVSLWGTDLAFRSPDPDTDWPGPNCVDGVFPWDWWIEVRALREGESDG